MNISIIVKSKNFSFYEKEKEINVSCGRFIPLGINVVTAFNEIEEIERRVQFLFRIGNDIYGSERYKNMVEWLQYKSTHCACCAEEVEKCGLNVNSCYLTLNGCYLN